VRWWVVASVVGYAVGFWLGLVTERLLSSQLNFWFLSRLIGQGVFAAVVGSLQWLVLRRHGSKAFLWPLATLITFPIVDVGLKIVRRPLGMPVPAAVILLGVLVGGATGIVLVRLSRDWPAPGEA
jgi:hypothetical protein